MEKDYFDDRSYQAIHNCLLEPGDVCYVCEKHMQKEINSSDISKLTKGIIVRKLTSVKKHPRGVKVMIFYIPHSKHPSEKEIQTVLEFYEKNKEEIDLEIPGTLYDYFRKGRVTYLVNSEGYILYG